MAARFTEGASIRATRTTNPPKKVAPPQSNTMKGLPGYIRTSQDPSSSGLTGRVGGGNSPKSAQQKGYGMHRDGPIPSRALKGPSGAKRFLDSANYGGSSDKHYRQTSTGPAGTIAKNTGTPQHRKAVDQNSYGPAHGGARPFRQQTGQNAHFSPGGVGAGHPGRMERLIGKARMSTEK